MQLKRREDFLAILANYHPSPETVEILQRTPLVLLLGLTGSGRNTIINKLVATGRYAFVLSDTTRLPKIRDGVMEQDGEAYNFRTEDGLLQDLKDGLFIEAELIHNQQVSGTSIKELVKAQQSGKIPVNEIDLGGTMAIARLKPDAVFILVVPPNFDEWMRRLEHREKMSSSEMYNRMQTALRILHTALSSERYILLVNDNLDETVQFVENYINHQIDENQIQQARQVAEQLKKDIKEKFEL